MQIQATLETCMPLHLQGKDAMTYFGAQIDLEYETTTSRRGGKRLHFRFRECSPTTGTHNEEPWGMIPVLRQAICLFWTNYW